MYLTRRMSAGRLQRMLERAHSGLSNPLIELPARDPASDRCQSAGASALCGTWADKPRGRRGNQRVAAASEISLRRLGSFPVQVVVGVGSASGCKRVLVAGVEVENEWERELMEQMRPSNDLWRSMSRRSMAR